MTDDVVSASMEHLAWVRIQCLQIACKARPTLPPEKQVALAMSYENYVMAEQLEHEAVH
jgi:hypothetical protein